jgi:hypothetical protein
MFVQTFLELLLLIAKSFQEVLLLDVTAQNSYMAPALIKIAIEELNQRGTGW